MAQARDMEFVANNPGDWHLHCHLPHHMMNQMVSMVGPLMMSHANTPRPGTVEAGMGIHEGHAFGDAAAPEVAATQIEASDARVDTAAKRGSIGRLALRAAPKLQAVAGV